MRSLMRTKPIEQSILDTEGEEGGHRLRRDLSALDLVVFGVGVTIGTGIFVLTGQAAGVLAGPAVALSFIVAAVACGLAALCYAEFASTVPVAGSAYTFSYATAGELIAWIIGWDLILELALGAATVSVGWSQYAADLLDQAGITVPERLYTDDPSLTSPNLLAAAIVLVLTTVICLGIKISARFNAVVVAIKVGIVFLVIIAGLFFVRAANYTPFVPPAGSPGAPGATAEPSVLQDLGLAPGAFGVGGIVTAAALVFFAFIGFDVVATAAEETREPRRDLPRGIIGSLIVCTVLYVAVSLVVVGMVRYDQMSIEAPLAEAFRSVDQPFFATVISVGSVIGLTTVIMIMMLGQSRVFFAMSRDRLLPPVFARVHPATGTPLVVTISTGLTVAVIAALVPLTELASLVNIGTLFAFVLVAIGVLVLRRTRPDLPRAFRVPGVPWLPILSVLASGYLMLNLSAVTWERFAIWMLIGLVFYAIYGRRRSRLAAEREDVTAGV
jgi:APA family basic amino acid/polyamine antiporter